MNIKTRSVHGKVILLLTSVALGGALAATEYQSLSRFWRPMAAAQAQADTRQQSAGGEASPAQADEAAALHRQRRPAEGAVEIRTERYLAAREHMRGMPHYSTALDRPLPAGGESGTAESAAAWTELGPGNLGGRTRALVIHPTNPDVMYAAGVGGGVWKTTNGGGAWRPLTDLLPNLAVSTLALDPKNPEVIYAGTGESVYGRVNLRGAGIFKSADGGASWVQLAGTKTKDFYYVYDIVVSPVDGRRVYAATGDGVWRSLDGGTNWTAVLGGVSNSDYPYYPCWDLAIRTDQTTDYLFAADNKNGYGEIYRNTDAGGAGTWVKVYGDSGMGAMTLAIAPSDQNTVYAVVESGSLHSVVRSVGGGEAGTWTVQVSGNSPVGVNRFLLSDTFSLLADACRRGPNRVLDTQASRGWYSRAIAVDPVDPNRLWVGGVDLFRSDDGGANWGLASYSWAERGTPQYVHSDQHVIVFHPQYNGTTNQTLLVAGDGGLYRTLNARAAVATADSAACDPTSSGVAWTSLNHGYNVTQFWHGLPSPDGTYYVGGTQGNGLVRGTDAAGVNRWKQILSGNGVGDVGYVAIDSSDPAIIYATKTEVRASVWKSTDSGNTFSQVISGVAEPGSSPPYFARLWVDPSDPQRLWLASYSLFRTNNGAARWNRTNGPVGAPFVVVAPTNSNYLMTADYRWLYFTSNSLAEAPDCRQVNPRYDPVSNGADPIAGAAFEPVNQRVAYIVYGISGGKHVWKTTDAGATWQALDGTGATALPDVPVNCIAVDPNNTSRIYVGTDMGVFVSIDGGANWAVENTGFVGVVIKSLAFSTGGGVTSLYAFTNGRGAWRVTTGSAGCRQTLTSPRASFGAAGGTGTINVIASSGSCQWTAESNEDWIAVTAGGSRSGAGAVSYSVAANGSFTARAGTLTVAGRSFNVTQAAAVDAIPPVITINSPSSSPFATRSNFISLKGSITDNVGVTEVAWSTDRGESGKSELAALPGLRLQPGPNHITITVRDAAGNVATATQVVIFSPEYTISTLAGTGQEGFSGDGGPAAEARLKSPSQLAIDRAGNLYVTDAGNYRIRKITPAGVITTVAGTGTAASGLGPNGDGGPATSANLQYLRGLTVTGGGDIYFLEGFTLLRRVAGGTGVLSTIASVGNVFHPSADVILNEEGEYLVTGDGENRIFKITPEGAISTFAGTGGFSGPLGDGGPATQATLFRPMGITLDKAGNALFADAFNRRVRKVGTDGIITTVAGRGEDGSFGDGGPATAALVYPEDVTLDERGNLYVAGKYRVRKVTPDGIINTIAGNDSRFYSGDGGLATSAGLSATGVAVDAAGIVYVADAENHRIRQLTPLPTPDTTAPSVAITSPTSGPAWTTLNGLLSLGGTAADNVMVTQVSWSNDRGGSGAALGTTTSWYTRIALRPGLNNLTVTAWDAAGQASSAKLAVTYHASAEFGTAAGRPFVVKASPSFISGGFGGNDGPAALAQLDSPRAMARDGAGNLYIADTANHRVRRVTPDGVIRTFAGNGSVGSGGDGGPATAASLNEPQGVAVDAAGNVYIADTQNHRVRRVTPAGIITTVAGSGVDGYGGDSGAAMAARLSSPLGLATDGAGNLYIADSGNNRVRKVAAGTGVMTTVAGRGYGYGGDNGPATEALLRSPAAVALDAAGNLYIADAGNFIIRQVSPAGVIKTIAGVGQQGDGGDGGPAAAARLGTVGGLAVDAAGNLFVADSSNRRIRRITPAGVITIVAGTGVFRSDDFGTESGDALTAQFNQPAGLAVDRTGKLYIADTGNHRVIVVNLLRETPPLVGVSAASFFGSFAARESIIAAFGVNLSARTESATALPLPTELAGVSVRVQDAAGQERLAPLFFVSPGQINFQVPPDTASGPATLAVADRSGQLATGPLVVSTVGPGLFTANANGQGVAAAVALRVKADGTQSFEPVAAFDAASNGFISVPLELGPEGEQVFLILFGTGMRFRSAPVAVTARVGGATAEVLFAGAQGGFVGLDQVNLRLPRELIGRGEVGVVLTVDGRTSNAVQIKIK